MSRHFLHSVGAAYVACASALNIKCFTAPSLKGNNDLREVACNFDNPSFRYYEGVTVAGMRFNNESRLYSRQLEVIERG